MNTIRARLVPSKYGMFVYDLDKAVLEVPYSLNAKSLRESNALFYANFHFTAPYDLEALAPSDCDIFEVSKMPYVDTTTGRPLIEVKEM